MARKITRREALKWSTFAGAGLALPASFTKVSAQYYGRSDSPSSGGSPQDGGGRLFGYVPFTQPLYLPPVATPQEYGTLNPTPQYIANRQPISAIRPTGNPDDVSHGIAPEFGQCRDWNAFDPFRTHEKEFLLYIEETTQRFVPGGPDTPVFTYRASVENGVATNPGGGRTPGPTFVVDYRAPVVVRNFNLLTRDRSRVNTTDHDHETSIHLHGGHAPSHSDGYPDFYTLAGEGRDYFYPNVGPRKTLPDGGFGFASSCEGPFDPTWTESTLWYHDHGMDVTGFNVARGLAGFYLVRSQREKTLADIGRIPGLLDGDGNIFRDSLGGPLDFGLAIGDQLFDRNGNIVYDFLDHDGRLGDTSTVNGVVQPFHRVERRKYRVRFLNASNSRYMEIRLSNQQPMHIIGADSWLFPEAVEVRSFALHPGQRHDVIIDFRGAPSDVFLENILVQEDGRRGDEIDPDQRITLLKFEVVGDTNRDTTDPLKDREIIRGFKGRVYSEFEQLEEADGGDPNVIGRDPGEGEFEFIPRREVHTKRKFEFERGAGVWVINNRFFNPRRADAVPTLGLGAEEWTVENGGGGWWHPFHAHLEGFQVRRVDGTRLRRERRFNNDTFNLEDGVAAKIYIKFRTFTGPFVFHCHAIEHEDMRMMGTHDPTDVGGRAGAIDANPPMDGETRINPKQSGVVPDCLELEEGGRIYFDVVGDLDRLEGRGVGFLECEFDIDGRGNG